MKKFEQLWLDQIDAIIDANIPNPDFRLGNVTSELEISRAKLYRNVLKLTGTSPSKYILKKRLRKAREMLDLGIYPTVRDTAMAVGFRRPEYFTKLFYKEYAILPSKILREEIV